MTTFQLVDQMTGPLNDIADSVYGTISAFENMQSACGSSFDSANFNTARDELDRITSSVSKLEETIINV